MGTKSCKAIISFLLMLIMAQFTIGLSGAEARQSKDIILVLDTSLSMVGQAGAQNILGKVKKSISDYFDQVEDGDRVTFITFDVDTRVYPTVQITDDNDRDILKNYITMTEATGLWTYTYKMIIKVMEIADNLEKEKAGRQTEIVIMTDAIDDPPPGDMKKFDIHALMDKYGKKKDWWIYVLSFNSLKNNEVVKQRLGADLGMISDKVKIIEAGEPEKGKRALIESEQQREAESRNIIVPIIIVGAAILLILAILFFVKRLSELKAAGRLEFWNNEVIEPYTQNFDLARRPSREVAIGKGLGCILNIRDITIKKPFVIKAIRHEGAVRMQIIGNESAVVEMINRQADGLLLDGDMFKVGNYTFKYFQA